MVKQRIKIFIFAVLLSLLVVPVINIASTPFEVIKTTKNWKKRTFLYNLDFASRWLAMVMLPLGISVDPKQVVVGTHGWLYYGDFYDKSLSAARLPANLEDKKTIEQISSAMLAWDAYLKSKGVKEFKVLIGPDKHNVYPEYLPRWAKPVLPSITDDFYNGAASDIYVDARGSMQSAKAAHPNTLLYYKTDSHWNFYGAAVAFHALGNALAKNAPELNWPKNVLNEVMETIPRGGGDLANILRIGNYLSDFETLIKTDALKVPITKTDFYSQKEFYKGENDVVFFGHTSTRVMSEKALNKKKVLWISDSFGNAMTYQMNITFTEILQLHVDAAVLQDGHFIKLIDEWKPDYVFFTIVERTSRSESFKLYPPANIVH